ncbi:MAG: hypothetical protein QM731_22005 [Chitinophagaceae bacterium]
MKKAIILLLLITGAMATNAQLKSDSSLLKKNAVTPVIKKTTEQQPATPTLAPSKTISKKVLESLPKEKDLTISDLQIQKDISTGLYTISCKITNVGSGNVLLDPISYSKCNDKSYVTEQNGLIISCKIEPENCSLSACGITNLLYVYKPDGTAFSFTTYSTEEARTLKPGQSFIAKTMHPTQIFWSKPSTCSSEKIEVMLTLDPINRIGDQDLTNNILKAYFPIQN